MQPVIYRPIGVIHSPFRHVKGMPIQAVGAESVVGTVEIEPEHVAGLKGIEGFSHIILIYHFHLSKGYSLEVKPFLDDELHGVFACRSPKRPNAIGISVVRLVRVEGRVIHVADVDIVDGTPLLDLKPYVPEFDVRKTERIGWLSKAKRSVRDVKADERFS
ncbi:MAG: tRNA (N6-threonylcarbamoyladenosine(37)-N6)-methyltransferase TrmO [Candidatus Bathyarchaeia archaeon]